MLEAIKMYFLPCLINVITVIYLTANLMNFNRKIEKNTKIILIFIWIIITILNYIYTINFVRIILSTLFNILFTYILFNNKKNIVVPTIVIEQMILFFSEISFYLILYIFKVNVDVFFNNFLGNLLGNIVICLTSIVLINITFVKIICKKLINYITKIEEYNKYLILLIFIFTINILLSFIYTYSLDNQVLVTNLIFIIIYSYIIAMLLNEKNRNHVFKEENQMLLSNLNEYEKMLDYQRVNNHENKNQLLVIKSMIEKNSNNIAEYIDEIIKEKREDNEIVYNKAKRIPSGGLQGLIYQKMLLMQEKSIEVKLDINHEIRKIDFGNLSSKMNYDICRIVGVIIDNAIEEATKFHKKDREIIISMYLDDVFIIEISNRIKDDIDLSKIYEKGYTNKEKGHGYGLSLLKKIIDENDKLNNEVKIINNIFTQIIKIKM